MYILVYPNAIKQINNNDYIRYIYSLLLSVFSSSNKNILFSIINLFL